MGVDVHRELREAKRSIESCNYFGAFVNMRKVAEEVSRFYVSRNGKLGEQLKRELSKSSDERVTLQTYVRVLQACYGYISFNSFNKHLSLFVYQAAYLGNKGAHESDSQDAESSRYKAMYLVGFFEEYILPRYERDRERARYSDVTRDFAGRCVKIRSSMNQLYVSANEGERECPLQAIAKGASAWEFFSVVVDEEGWAAFRADHSGMWVSVRADIDEGAAPLTASAHEPHLWEHFKIFSDGTHHFVQSRLNGKWLSCQVDQEGCAILASAPVRDAWEAFDITTA